MTEVNSKHKEIHDHRFPCDCSDWHHVRVTTYDDGDYGYLEIADTYEPITIVGKIKASFNIWRSKTHYNSGVILDETNVNDLIDVLSEYQKRF